MKPRLRYLLPLIFSIGVLGMCVGNAPADDPGGVKKVSIIYTTDMKGKLQSCG